MRNRKRGRRGRKRKRRRPRQFNKHGIPIEGERPPRRKYFPGQRLRDD